MIHIMWPWELTDCLLEKPCDFPIKGICMDAELGMTYRGFDFFLKFSLDSPSLPNYKCSWVLFHGLWIVISQILLFPIFTCCDLALRKGLESIGLDRWGWLAPQRMWLTYPVFSNQWMKRWEGNWTLVRRKRYRKVLCKLKMMFWVFLQLFSFFCPSPFGMSLFSSWHAPLFLEFLT